MLAAAILFLAAVVAGLQNALAGGGSFVTFPALVLAGLDARAANITSTVALFPGQITTGLAGRRYVSGTPGLPFLWLFVLSLIGGAVGGLLLLATPPGVFARLVPWLVLFATAVFAWGSFARRPSAVTTSIGPTAAAIGQFLIAIYGGYFGGGIGILMLAALTMAGLPIRNAGSTKNVLAGVMNASAVVIFLFSPDVYWSKAVAVAVGAVIGGQIGAWALHRVNERLLRVCIIALGLVLFVGLLLDAP
ncbi:MAG: sulfite exporter TauE/SafE family protein [Acetobacteraceae bacterium]|nr:sulfite exporter TauE/SafE family protein [Acetobacteraceae bacterium]